MEKLTTTQRQRLAELNASPEVLDKTFEDANERNVFFRGEERELIKTNKEQIIRLMEENKKTLALEVEQDLSAWLTEREGFAQVSTPIIIPEQSLEKMGIDAEHPLIKQVFWLDGKKCLRPMLAPNLYEMMRDLQKLTKRPVKIFECGPCFRKESQGAAHTNEFTMLNLVDFAGVKEGEQMERLRQLADDAMRAVGIRDYELVTESSEVYGQTLDICVQGIEVASGSYGPHSLDAKWGVFETWVGFGIGIERVAMAKAGYRNIRRVSRSLSYLDGARLNL